MKPHHHPGDDLLIAYAAGSQEEPVSLIVATHLALCPRCRHEVARLEELGGIFLENSPSEMLADSTYSRLMARLNEMGDRRKDRTSLSRDTTRARPARVSQRSIGMERMLPKPLRDYIGGSFDNLNWTSFRGLSKAELLQGCPGFKTRLMRIKAGTAMPIHTHVGSELTSVLSGSFADDRGHYARGDFCEADAAVNHQPFADANEDCICLAVTDAPLRLTGAFSRVLNPILHV